MATCIYVPEVCRHPECEEFQRETETLKLARLEILVERACQAIYAQREGYWPSGIERHHIAIALLSARGSGGSDG